MTVCLLRFNVLRNVCLGSSNFALCSRSEIHRPINYSAYSSFSPIHNAVKSKQFFGGAIRLSFPASTAQVSSVRQIHKLHVKHLPKDSSEDMLHEHFSQFGSITQVKMRQTGDIHKSPDSACVVFSNKEAFDKALSVQSPKINDQPISICQFKEISFMVPALSKSTTRDSLHNYFSRYGNVFRCALRHGTPSGTSGFVDFFEPNEAHNLLPREKHVIDGKAVEVQRLFPKELTRYVDKLSPSTTDESLAAYFAQFGTLTQACVMKNAKKGESHKFGYISYSSEEEINSVINSGPHIVDGQEVNIRGNRKFQLSVTGLPPNTTEESLQQYFKQFGPVFECKVGRDKQTNELLNHGWVYFSSEQGLNEGLAARPHTINGKKIITRPNDKMTTKACTLFVGGLSRTTTDEVLHKAFSKFGSIEKCTVKWDSILKESKGFGFVEYSTIEEVCLI
uniref:RRM domain-containing protein n=1 Tax=Ditylenchus dipsaci TaxID=166011 RepID=A0A915EP78_9BILA